MSLELMKVGMAKYIPVTILSRMDAETTLSPWSLKMRMFCRSLSLFLWVLLVESWFIVFIY